MDDLTSITSDDLAASHDNFVSDRANLIAKNAVSSNGIRQAARTPEGVAANTMTFDIEVQQGDRCNQERSGRCWMFASLNTMRYRVDQEVQPQDLRALSGLSPLLGQAREVATGSSRTSWIRSTSRSRDASSPIFSTDPIGDGGQWDMFKSLVKKYGVVPKEAMPETACSRNTREMDSYLTRYLRGAAKRLRQSPMQAEVSADDLRSMKKEMLDDVYHLLVAPASASRPRASRCVCATRTTSSPSQAPSPRRSSSQLLSA
jgi:bleomycin hydrolase